MLSVCVLCVCVCVCMLCVCVCVCVCERERERDETRNEEKPSEQQKEKEGAAPVAISAFSFVIQCLRAVLFRILRDLWVFFKMQISPKALKMTPHPLQPPLNELLVTLLPVLCCGYYVKRSPEGFFLSKPFTLTVGPFSCKTNY